MMRRRQFIAGGLAAALPVCGRAQPAERVRRIGVLVFSAENDPIAEMRLSALRDSLQQFGWTEGVNVRFNYRFGGGDPARLRSYAEELVTLAPDVIVTGAAPATGAVQQ